MKAVKEEVGDRATIICGTGSNDTRHSVELTEGACRAGADAVLVVTPYYNKPNRAGLRAHFEAVAEAAGDTPVVLYNIPSRCVINLAPDFLAELAAEHPERGRRSSRPTTPSSGRSTGSTSWPATTSVFLRCLELGGTGGILVSSHLVGAEMRAMYEAAIAGDGDRAHELDARASADLRGDRR